MMHLDVIEGSNVLDCGAMIGTPEGGLQNLLSPCKVMPSHDSILCTPTLAKQEQQTPHTLANIEDKVCRMAVHMIDTVWDKRHLLEHLLSDFEQMKGKQRI